MDILKKYLLGISIVYGVIFVVIIYLMFHRYYIKKKDAGMKITTIKRPMEVIGRKLILYIVIFIASSVNITNDIILVLPVIYSWIAIILLAWFSLQPQQIYENGILVSTGFIKWSNIKCAESTDAKENVITVTLYENHFGSNTVKLYCYPGVATNFVDVIASNMNMDL